MPRSLLLPVVLVTAAFDSRAAAQHGDARVRADLELARGLAHEKGWLDLAVDVVGELRAGGVPVELEAEVELLESELIVLAQAAATAREQELARAGREALAALAEHAQAGSRSQAQAYLGLGEALRSQGALADAAEAYERAVDAALPRDAAAWSEMSSAMAPAEKQSRFDAVQFAVAPLLECLLGSEQPARAARAGLEFHDTWKREGLALTEPIGDLARLALARALIEAGGFVGGDLARGESVWRENALGAGGDDRPALDVALSIARAVSAANEGNTLQVTAQRLMAEIVSRPGAAAEPAVLLEAGRGECAAGNPTRALELFQRALAGLEREGDAVRRARMPELSWHLARALERLDRTLEAALVHEAALDRWRGDATWDERNARGMLEALQAIARHVRGEARIERLLAKAERLVVETGGTLAPEVAYRQAERAFAAGNFAEAQAAFEKVEHDAESYEKARVLAGVCAFEQGALEAAEAVFDEYLHRFSRDPANATDDPRRLARRAEATAMADFYWGAAAFELARAGRGDWSAVVARLDGYEQRFEGQPEFSAAALHHCVVALGQLGRSAAAARALETLLARFPGSTFSRSAASELDLMLEQAWTAEPDPQRKRELRRALATHLQRVNRAAAKPSFDSLRRESQLWIELGEWVLAEPVLARLQRDFGASAVAEEARGVRQFALPDLGRVLLKQRRPREAAEVLAPLIEAQEATRATARDYARALAGWAEYVPGASDAEGRVEEAPGVGGTASFQTATSLLDALARASEPWEAEWYGYTFDLVYALRQWGRTDPARLDAARTQLDYVAVAVGLHFERARMPEDLRRAYRWLAGALE